MSDAQVLTTTEQADREERGLERLRAIRMTEVGAQLDTMADVWTMATSICRAGMQPYTNPKSGERMTPAMVMVALQMGLEVGLPPMTALKNIAVINGKPTIWGDALLALAYRKNLIESIDEDVRGEGDQRAAVCTVERRGMRQPVTRTFSVADAKRAGLWGRSGPWSSYPDRMLAMRARGFALRDAVPDALGGFTLAEEAQDLQVQVDEPASRTQALLAELADEAPAAPVEAEGEGAAGGAGQGAGTLFGAAGEAHDAAG